MSSEKWAQLLLYDENDSQSDILGRCQYLGNCINETLRLDPSVRISTPHEISEDIELCGIRILKEQTLAINIYALQTNPAQWVEPFEYIPERFDPKN